MKFYNGQEVLEIPLKTRITPKLKVEFNELYSKLKEYEADRLMREGLEGIEYQVSKDGQTETRVTNPMAAAKIMQAQQMALETDILETNTNIYLDIIKLITDVPESQKAVFNQGLESDFWQGQDINSIISEVRSFRSRIIS